MNFKGAISLIAGVILFLGTAAAQNSTVVKSDAERIKFNPRLFGFFIEHFDNQIYGGLYDLGNPLSDEDGFRTDVIEAAKELKVPLLRWPGGCFASTYHWKKAVGPTRTPTFDKTWGVEDPNTFGTDEFVKWCKKVGCEPYIVANAGIGSNEEMCDWVEYCNISVGEYGRWRIANGYPDPYNVKILVHRQRDLGSLGDGNQDSRGMGPARERGGKMKLAIDEWQLRGWIHPGIGNPRQGFDFEARRQNDIASTYTLSDAVYAACFLNACLRHSDIVDFTCFSTLVNTRGAIFVHPEGIVRRVIYHALWMYSNLTLPYVVPTTESVERLSHKDKSTGVLAGNSPDDYNDIGREDRVTPHETTLPVKDGTVIIPAHSVTFVFID